MFKFNDISEDNEVYNFKDFLLSPKEFFNKRRNTKKIFLFDLRNNQDYNLNHIPGAKNIPIDQFEDSIYQMPFSGEILLYGSSLEQAKLGGEILYDNGFDTFYISESYENILSDINKTYINLKVSSKKEVLNIFKKHINDSKQILLLTDIKSDRKANYSIKFVKLGNEEKDYKKIIYDEFNLYVHNRSLSYLEGTEIFIDDDNELKVFNENMSIVKIDGSVEDQIKHVLEEEVNPMVAAHGGVVSLLEVKDQKAFLEFGGGCQGCGMIDVTLKQGVEVIIKDQIPEIEAVYDVTDHAEGSNPYYKPSEK